MIGAELGQELGQIALKRHLLSGDKSSDSLCVHLSDNIESNLGRLSQSQNFQFWIDVRIAD